jgi:hypothetical protein
MSERCPDCRQKVDSEYAVAVLTEAIRLTVEYVGLETLPPVPGWSWFDALTRYDPHTAQSFLEQWRRFPYLRLREDLRRQLLATNTTEAHDTYEDGFSNGLSVAIQALDKINDPGRSHVGTADEQVPG